MQDFIQKWNDDPRYKTKIKLTVYTLFVIFVAIFAVSSNNNIENKEDDNFIKDEIAPDYTNNENQTTNIENENNTYRIELPSEYK